MTGDGRGGGSTSTYPWETWRWRYLEGIGENIILEFVDPSGSGEYHMTMDPSEKDALLHVPGAGLSLMESMGMSSKLTASRARTAPIYRRAWVVNQPAWTSSTGWNSMPK